MSLFQELYALATSATLTMIVSADEKTGTLTISVLPKPKKDTGEAALTRDLTLTASPEEFDAGFVEALRGYREARQSLAEQAAATCEVLAAAKSLSAGKAAEATKKGKASASAMAPYPAPASEIEADDADKSDNGHANPATVTGETLSLFG